MSIYKILLWAQDDKKAFRKKVSSCSLAAMMMATTRTA